MIINDDWEWARIYEPTTSIIGISQEHNIILDETLENCSVNKYSEISNIFCSTINERMTPDILKGLLPQHYLNRPELGEELENIAIKNLSNENNSFAKLYEEQSQLFLLKDEVDQNAFKHVTPVSIEQLSPGSHR